MVMTKVQEVQEVATLSSSSSSSNARKRARKKATAEAKNIHNNGGGKHKPQELATVPNVQTILPNIKTNNANANANKNSSSSSKSNSGGNKSPSSLDPRRLKEYEYDNHKHKRLNKHENRHTSKINNNTSSTKKQNRKKRRRERNQVNCDDNDESEEEEPEDDLLAFAAAWANETPADNVTATTTTTPSTSTSTSTSTSNNNPLANHHKKQKITRLPPPFPRDNPALHQKLPPRGFLKNQEPYRQAFQAAIETCYQGLVWESHQQQEEEAQLQKALQIMDQHGLFRTDVTQPAGLGAKLVPSYVTRCLLGEPGTTYRYLGLRMFAHPWNGYYSSNNNNNNKNATSRQLQSALQAFQTLNTKLTERTKQHLQDLAHQRQRRGDTQQPLTVGRAGFNVTLINKMTMDNYKRLREEPMFQTQKYTVGWHADSSLEHYSTIAVYHTLIKDDNNADNNNNNNNNNLKKKPPKKKPKKSNNTDSTSEPEEDEEDNDWMVALRVTHHAEGPNAKRLGDITVDETAPPIAVALPSGSTYFMLDDFNHHHQHAVLAPTTNTASKTKTIRYSSTHRLLRQGHTVYDILARCQKVLSIPKNGNEREQSSTTTSTTSHALITNVRRLPHGPKHWRSEQVLLNELENEWLRQFFIQGTEHKRLLWAYWQEPIQQLFQYWELLEARTLQLVTLLQRASETKCGKYPSLEQQQQQQGKEALQIVTRISRGGDNTKHKNKINKSTHELIYNPVATHIIERAKSRELWSKRERDAVFQRLPQDCRPIPFPVVYGAKVSPTGASTSSSSASPMARSSMPNGSSEFLSQLASNVQAWGKAFENGDVELLPKDTVLKLQRMKSNSVSQAC